MTELREIQDELVGLVSAHDQKPWKEIAVCLLVVYTEKLFTENHSSMNAWIDWFAKKEELNPSVLKKYFLAIQTFLRFDGDVETFAKNRLSYTKLATLSNIASHSHELAQETWPLVLEDSISMRQLQERLSLARSGMTQLEEIKERLLPITSAIKDSYMSMKEFERERLFLHLLESLQRCGAQVEDYLLEACDEFSIKVNKVAKAS